MQLDRYVELSSVINQTIHQDLLQILEFLPRHCVDLFFIDPPYNLHKTFNFSSFKKTNLDTYTDWLISCLDGLENILKPTASIYICSDWQSSPAVFEAVRNCFQIRNRITWEREKGRRPNETKSNCSLYY